MFWKKRARHNPQDPRCIYWTGDRAGYDLAACCEPCALELFQGSPR